MVEAEISMKALASSCTVVGALIVTIMFAASFTIPGGNDDTTGFPILIDENLFFCVSSFRYYIPRFFNYFSHYIYRIPQVTLFRSGLPQKLAYKDDDRSFLPLYRHCHHDDRIFLWSDHYAS